MHKRIWVLTVATFLGLVSMTALATTPTYDNIYVFGDSYCDVGNIFAATGGAEPAAPYFNGRFSNGPIWLDHVAGFLGVPMKASLLGGTNYAFGGAWVTAPQSIPGGTIPSVPQQVQMYLGAHGGKADPNALYILEGGGNDILLSPTTGSPQALGYQIAVGLADSELMLRQAGAKHFVIPNLLNVGLLPAAADRTAFAAAATNAVNNWARQAACVFRWWRATPAGHPAYPSDGGFQPDGRHPERSIPLRIRRHYGPLLDNNSVWRP